MNKLMKRMLTTVLTITTLIAGTAMPVSAQAVDVAPEAVVQEVAPSQEIYDFVERMYNNFLGRQSDADGKEGWAQMLADGEIDGASFAYGFAHSPEFEDIYNTIPSEEFVTRLYNTFLGRAPEAEGLEGWTEYADNWMPLDWMVGGFVNSQEFTNICESFGIIRGTYQMPDVTPAHLDGAAIGNFVERFYTEALGRASEPAGKRHWATMIATRQIAPAELVYGFMESEEFVNRAANMTNEEYVNCMYHTFFDREPDQAGFTEWVNGLNDGSRSRHDIIDGFVGSAEYIQMVNRFLDSFERTEDGHILFGRIEQDANLENGPEKIEWRVLKEDENGVLLLSEYIIAENPYYEEDQVAWNDPNPAHFFWADSATRAWLNGEFYQSIFSDREQSRIVTQHLEDFAEYPDITDCIMQNGPETDDKIFLLSREEIAQYFPVEGIGELCGSSYWLISGTYECLQAEITAAILKAHNYDGMNHRRAWTLRSHNNAKGYGLKFWSVSSLGDIDNAGAPGVRPAIYVAK